MNRTDDNPNEALIRSELERIYGGANFPILLEPREAHYPTPAEPGEPVRAPGSIWICGTPLLEF